MTNTLFDALVAPHAGSDATFLECDDGTTVSRGAFVRRVAQLAHVLAASGVAPGDRVLVQASKHPDTLALYGAALQAGAVHLPLNTAYTGAELRHFAEDARPRVMVCDETARGAVAPLAEAVGARLLTLGSAGGGGTLAEAADGAPDRFRTVPRGPDDLAALLYTSGTTGRSKGAMLSHRNLLQNARALTDLWEITDRDRLIHALPIFHTHGLFVAINTALLAGARVRLMRAFDAEAVLAELPRSTLLMGVPTYYTRLLDEPALTRERCAAIRLFVSGSAPLLAETHAAFERRTGHRILERYGMTETNMIASNPLHGERIAGTVGFALPGTEVVVTDPGTGAPLPAGEIGMIEVRGDGVFRGYLNLPDKTREELRETGFFVTGDLGALDAEGRLRIVGRQKDLIITGGLNVYPREVEDAIDAAPGVRESAVFGVPDPDFGESVVAAVVAEADAALDLDAVAETVAASLARFKRPRRYVVLDALPRNAMGKVQKAALRAEHGG
ncbi:AMP-binding protein [Jannaschia sp. W003]|uniref:AMP-binding protein n=1 Tax=Jannaschia sp. W003 TaxID=2867012 RepID=UPI0021A76F01|nr:AMP-binding protein [Jannaschia sp. W003]UWQ23201.1 AMP-binding protein [Jannaschia sp. W003]